MPRERKPKDNPRTSAVELVAGLPEDVKAIRQEIQRFFNTELNGKKIGSHQFGAYAFYDYDSEPIYVGQTKEKLSGRIGRHLTNQRTDAVAMNVLDPFEVAYIEVWPLDDFMKAHPPDEHGQVLNRVEYSVFQQVLRNSELGAVLNEKTVSACEEIELPISFRQRIIPDAIYKDRKHPDIRIARRSATIANLARVISERSVSKGLRRTLLIQARRLERLATRRLKELGVEPDNETM